MNSKNEREYAQKLSDLHQPGEPTDLLTQGVEIESAVDPVNDPVHRDETESPERSRHPETPAGKLDPEFKRD